MESQQYTLYVHRKGASRALGPGHADLLPTWRDIGQPGLIGDAANTNSYITVAATSGQERAFGSSCHGVGPAPNPSWPVQAWRGLENLDVLRRLGTLVRGPAVNGVVEELSEAGSDSGVIMDAAEQVGLARRVARLSPLIRIRG